MQEQAIMVMVHQHQYTAMDIYQEAEHQEHVITAVQHVEMEHTEMEHRQQYMDGDITVDH